jgi:hypothetical protein
VLSVILAEIDGAFIDEKIDGAKKSQLKSVVLAYAEANGLTPA